VDEQSHAYIFWEERTEKYGQGGWMHSILPKEEYERKSLKRSIAFALYPKSNARMHQ
jgi:hypothetical protein